VKVRLVVSIDIDPDRWETEYGERPHNNELWNYFYGHLDRAVVDSGARSTVKDVRIR
jgi:hypothetical protein